MFFVVISFGFGKSICVFCDDEVKIGLKLVMIGFKGVMGYRVIGVWFREEDVVNNGVR